MTRTYSLCIAATLLLGGAAACDDDSDPATGGATDSGTTDSGTGTGGDAGGGGEDSGTPDTDAGDSDAATPETPGCAAYCAAVTAACTGDNAQYEDLAACMAYCTDVDWEEGESGATDGNSIACRTYHAGVAATTDAAVHCPHAGPTGGNVCGTPCDNYCHNIAAHCGDQDLTDGADCATACADLAEDTAVSPVTAGDSVQCRVYHSSTLAAADPTTHCPHASITATAPCEGATTREAACAAYCETVSDSCKGGKKQYESEDACNAYCNAVAWPIGADDATDGNSIKCREYHAGLADTMDDEVHCPHAGPTGGDVCGDACANYCHNIAAHCSDMDLTGGMDCATVCAGMATDDSGGVITSGDSVQCRVYHSGTLAFANGATHCPHASSTPTAPCAAP